MSSSDTESTRKYLAGWDALHQLIAEGKSISGRERHCCYLNMGNGRFANVSAVTGLDLPDDGRATGLSDWDQDGDIDMWMTNRTSPSVRFLRNDADSRHRFVALRLEGTTCNRDAVGARVELFVPGADTPWATESTCAGNGFLSQSSKWLHFGLGENDAVERVVVHWPGGDAEEFRGIEVAGRLLLRQGSGQSQRAARRDPVELPAVELPKPAKPETIRLVSLSAQSSPPFPAAGPGPVLVVLWATWCQPCLAELSELAKHTAELKAAQLNVTAFNVDDVDSRDDTDSQNAEPTLTRLGFRFPHAIARDADMRSIEQIRAIFSDKPGTFALPTSFLIDRNGRVRVVYQGGVTAEQAIRDLQLVDGRPEEVRDAAVPFAGRWMPLPPRDAIQRKMQRAAQPTGPVSSERPSSERPSSERPSSERPSSKN